MRRLSVERIVEEKVKNKWVLFKGRKRKLYAVTKVTLKSTNKKGVETSSPAFRLEFSNGSTSDVDPKTIIKFIDVTYRGELEIIENYIDFMNPAVQPVKVNFRTANLIKDMKGYVIKERPAYTEVTNDGKERPLIYLGHVGNTPCLIDVALGNRDYAMYIKKDRIPLSQFKYVYESLV